MREFISIVFRAMVLAFVFGSLGLAVNFLSKNPLPLIYAPPNQVEVSGQQIKLIDQAKAHELYGDFNTKFIDTRKPEDYAEGHIQGALFLNPDSFEEDFVKAQPLMSEDNQLILYCYGPECDMAERVAGFLANLGYKNMLIMSSGYRSWQGAGFPVKKNAEHP